MCLLAVRVSVSANPAPECLLTVATKSLTFFKQVETPYWKLCANKLGNRCKHDTDEIRVLPDPTWFAHTPPMQVLMRLNIMSTQMMDDILSDPGAEYTSFFLVC